MKLYGLRSVLVRKWTEKTQNRGEKEILFCIVAPYVMHWVEGRAVCRRKSLSLLFVIIFAGFGVNQNVCALSLAGLKSGVSGLANSIGAKVKPVVSFFKDFTTSLITSLKNTDYNDQMIVVYDQGTASQGTSSDASDPTPPTKYSIAYDFGFRAGGDIEQPFGFTFDALGRYTYTPMTAQLLPGVIPDITDPTGQRKKPLSLGDGLAPALIKGLLGILVGGPANAEKVWAPVGFFLKVSPETQFLLKIVILLNTAAKNSSSLTGLKAKYPSLTDVPFELMLLIFRLVITPDISETLKLNPDFGVEKSYRWEKVVTLSRPSKFLAKMPAFFVNLLNSFKPSLDSSELQEYKDRFATPISDLQEMYSEVRQQHPYEVRVKYAQNNVVDVVNVKSLNPSDKELLEYMIQQVVSERYRGLKTFISGTESVSTNVTVGSADGMSSDASVNPDQGLTDSSVAADATGSIELISVDVNKMMDFISPRIPVVKDFLADLLSDAKKTNWSNDLLVYLQGVSAGIDAEFSDLKKMASDLTDARKALALAQQTQGAGFSMTDPSQVLEQRVAQSILDKLDAITEQEAASLGKLSGNKVPVPLLGYLDIKFWQTMRIMRQGFSGDRHYLFNDAQLTLPKAVLQAYAICFRANMDLLYLEDLIKKDSRPFLVKSQNGETLSTTGIQMYKSYTDAERYLIYCQNKFTTYRNAQGKKTVQDLMQDPQFASLQKDLNNANVLYSRARSSFRSQLRQFEFDRRLPRAHQVSRVMIGDASMDGLGDVNVVSVSQTQATTDGSASPTGSTGVVAVGDSTASGQDEAAVATPTNSGATQGAEMASSTTQGTAEAAATPASDDPFAIFNTAAPTPAPANADAAVTTDSSVGTAISDFDFKNPIFDGDPNAQAPAPTAQDSFLGITPQVYDYPRSVNDFLKKEFALLLMRCPQFQDGSNAQIDRIVFNTTGMHFADLLQSASGQASDISVAQDRLMLPGNDFFSAKPSLDQIGTPGTPQDMEALGQQLAAQYGADGTGGNGSMTDGSTDLFEDTTADFSSGLSDDQGGQDSSLADALASQPVAGVSDAFSGLATDSASVDLSADDQMSLAQEAAAVSADGGQGLTDQSMQVDQQGFPDQQF